MKKDITKMDVDCIVNAANSQLSPGGGVCGAIFAAAGYSQLNAACQSIGGVKTGDAVITPGFRLKAKNIIHAVGPIYHGGKYNEEEKLSSCYKRSLEVAKENNLESIAFPLISSGIYGYPYNDAYLVAKRTILEFLKDNDMTVYLSLFKKVEVEHANLDTFIKEEFHPFKAEAKFCVRVMSLESCSLQDSSKIPEITTEESFSEKLFKLIDENNMTDSEFYHKANMDRRLFSKIKKDHYRPSKETAISCCIALMLDLKQTEELLSAAGYTLSKSILFDCIIEYCIVNKQYDIYTINDYLYFYDQQTLN